MNEKKEVTIKSAVCINIAAKYSNVIFTLIANIVLARILSAEDYGIVALITVFVNLFQLFADMGLGAGVVQNKELDKDDISNIFSLTFYISFCLMGLFCILSIFVSWFYKNEIYSPICILLSISVFFYTLNIIPNAILMKDKKFVLIGIRTVVVAIVAYSLTITLALIGFRYYALVIQSIFSAFAIFVWNYGSNKIQLKLKFSFSSIKKILGYSAFDFAFNITNYFSRNFDNLMIGKVIGNTALGYYSKAYNLMLYPVSYLTNVITPILHPILSDHKDNKEYIFEKYFKVFKCLSLLGVFISIYCFYASEEIVLILYGGQWKGVVPCMTALSISIWFQMTSSSCGSIYKSLGRTDLMFKSATRYVPIQLIFILAGVFSGSLILLSWCVSISFIFKFVVEYYFMVTKGFKMKLGKFYRNIIPEIIIAGSIIIAMIIFGSINIENIWLSALYKGVGCSVSYIIVLTATKQYKFLLVLMPEKLKKAARFLMFKLDSKVRGTQ